MELLSQRGVSRRKRSLRTFAVTGVAVCAAVVLAVPGAQAAGTPGWRFVAVFPQAQQLLSVSAASATNAWAVGQTSGLGLFTSRWNGKKWQPVANPNRLGGVGPLIGAAVAATAGARAWVFTMTENDELPLTDDSLREDRRHPPATGTKGAGNVGKVRGRIPTADRQPDPGRGRPGPTGGKPSGVA
jgi:hypothetical protein